MKVAQLQLINLGNWFLNSEISWDFGTLCTPRLEVQSEAHVPRLVTCAQIVTPLSFDVFSIFELFPPPSLASVHRTPGLQRTVATLGHLAGSSTPRS